MRFPLTDNFGRRMDYLRLSVTDRCNLRCGYCMPEEGIPLIERSEILSWEEMERLSSLFVDLGIRKIRITGGEPFVRKGLINFLTRLRQLPERPLVAVTTNGTLLERSLKQLQDIGVRHLNVSLDSLHADTFRKITRRTGHAATLSAIEAAAAMDFNLKINTVVIPGMNDHEIPEFARLTRDRNLEVRFIEPMPFNGHGKVGESITGEAIKAILCEQFDLHLIANDGNGVAEQFQIPGHKGTLGLIYGASRTFCDSCSRIRVSAQGQMRTCLYGVEVLDLRHLLRSGAADATIRAAIRSQINQRFKDGFEAEQHRNKVKFESMASIGG